MGGSACLHGMSLQRDQPRAREKPRTVFVEQVHDHAHADWSPTQAPRSDTHGVSQGFWSRCRFRSPCMCVPALQMWLTTTLKLINFCFK